ncbi:MAG: hypothetical protein RPU35_11730, partial [Candidatus Sedimenticola sp. (ex Thyasira tokunagai)]
RSGNELAMLSLRASDRDGQGSNRLSKIECVWGLGCPKTHHEIKDTLAFLLNKSDYSIPWVRKRYIRVALLASNDQ